MTSEPSGGFGRVADAFEDDLCLEVRRAGADGILGAGRNYTKAMMPIGWVPCVGEGCQLGGVDLAHELGPLVLSRQRAVVMGIAGCQVDEIVRLPCVGRRLQGRGHSLACGGSFIIHIVGTLRTVPALRPAGAARGH